MTFLVVSCLLYFLPAIIGRNRSDSGSLFVVNLLFGWTIIGWFIVLIWACSSDRPYAPAYYAPAGMPTASAGRFCSSCGAVSAHNARFCAACGRPN